MTPTCPNDRSPGLSAVINAPNATIEVRVDAATAL
jgi:hypothetical protein